MLIVAISLGAYLSLFGGHEVLAVSGVALADNDTTGYGLDGRDFTITWTPGAPPAGFESNMIYIVTSTLGQVLNISNFNTTGCNGSPCNHADF